MESGLRELVAAWEAFALWVGGWWPQVGAALALVLSVVASVHAILHKREVRASIAWAGVIWLAPFVGSALYLLLGINRIERRAAALSGEVERVLLPSPSKSLQESRPSRWLERAPQLAGLARLVAQVTGRPLIAGNRVTPLEHGDEAYPAMIEAIEGAERSVSLSTYIFDRDPWGMRFVEALGEARARGVQVRVLIDAAGLRYSFPSVRGELKKRGVPTRRFIPASRLRRAPYFNLRNHRKILVVDGRTGFTGGMNIREGHVLGEAPKAPVGDTHFRLEGPVVAHLQAVFVEDWAFSSGERLDGDLWFPELDAAGETLARGVSDGPDEELDRIRWVWLGAIACASSSVRVVTPYFLPDPSLITALNVAAMRGVEVDVVLPARVNLRFVQWAMWAHFWEFTTHGVRVWLSPPPFDHSKLMTVDGQWTFAGSANWDPRSLRLNFEFGVECYDGAVASRIDALIEARIAEARRLTEADVHGRNLAVRLRDGIARLMTPYL